MYTPSKPLVIMSAIGVSFGGAVFFKEYVGGCKYQGLEKLDGKVAIVTGANSGIGKEVTRELAQRGAKVFMGCRDLSKCHQTRKEIVLQTKNKNVSCEHLDLSSLESVRKFAENIKQKEQQVHMLVNNAGVMRCPKQVTRDGFEMQLGVNHLGHFLLTSLLLDQLKAAAPSRIINVSSAAHKRGSIKFEDLNSDKNYDPSEAYYQSKLANILFTKELHRRLESSGVTTFAVHPGIVSTNITRHMGFENSIFSYIFVKPFLWFFSKSPRQGAQTVLSCTLGDNVEKYSGRYFSDCTPAPTSFNAENKADAKRLWAISERWTRLS